MAALGPPWSPEAVIAATEAQEAIFRSQVPRSQNGFLGAEQPASHSAAVTWYHWQGLLTAFCKLQYQASFSNGRGIHHLRSRSPGHILAFDIFQPYQAMSS